MALGVNAALSSVRLNVSSPYLSLQSQLSHSIQSAVSSRGVAHSYTSSQLQNAVAAAAALGSRSDKHVSGRSLQQGAKGSSGSSGSQGNVVAWRKQSGGNTGMLMLDQRNAGHFFSLMDSLLLLVFEHLAPCLYFWKDHVANHSPCFLG